MILGQGYTCTLDYFLSSSIKAQSRLSCGQTAVFHPAINNPASTTTRPYRLPHPPAWLSPLYCTCDRRNGFAAVRSASLEKAGSELFSTKTHRPALRWPSRGHPPSDLHDLNNAATFASRCMLLPVRARTVAYTYKCYPLSARQRYAVSCILVDSMEVSSMPRSKRK